MRRIVHSESELLTTGTAGQINRPPVAHRPPQLVRSLALTFSHQILDFEYGCIPSAPD